ncbi:hypothetical protein LWI29_004388 [Acer saccharum]|uniref:SKP1-like protein n=1 Tax=Acer saccharum TaxID=4024 RepID=A0AA39RNS2_ACESA|nr:hypothetical protein LWI29_004388 [Acer saccharum]
MSTNRKITLHSSDGQTFEVDEAVALKLQAIKPMMEDGRANNGILLGLTSKTISKVIKYCKKHVESPKSDDCTTGAVDDDLKAWDAEFVNVDRDTLFDLVIAAEYLKIKSLLNLTCETVADLTDGKTPDELIKWFYFKIAFD